ncbi:MAG: cation:proton antiporter [Actinomycetales bacterium]|nr:cation:proton antiporter [Actinomycetales bacterium]
MHGTELVTLVVVGVVLLIGLVAFFAGRIGVAAPLALTVVGIGIGAIPALPPIEIEPEIILTLVLPPLLYAAARQVPFVDFRRNVGVIGILAVGLVAVSAVLVGLLVHLVWAVVPLALAIALGAVVAPPDAVAATSLGKRLGLPPRIVTILEGEGLVNDATALVLLSTALGIAAAGTTAVEPGAIALRFLWAVVGATVIGIVIGWITVRVRERVREGVLDMALALVVPFVAFLLAELAGASGVVAVVAAGILVGNSGVFRIPAAYRVAEGASWGTFTLFVENGVFLLMGVQLWPVVRAVAAQGDLGSVLLISGAVILLLVAVRFAVTPLLVLWLRRNLRRSERQFARTSERVGSITAEDLVARAEERGDRRVLGRDRERVLASTARRIDLFRRRLEVQDNDLTAERDQALGWRDSVVLGFAGMRGVVTVVAVQTIPLDAPHREGLVLIAFAVAIVTLLVQGLLLPSVVRALKLTADARSRDRGEMLDLRVRLREVGDAEIEAAVAELGDRVTPRVAEEARSSSANRVERMRVWAESDPSDPDNPVDQFLLIRERELAAQRRELRRLRSLGAYSSETIQQLREAFDADELELDTLRRNSGSAADE